jgi:hypothetical protein
VTSFSASFAASRRAGEFKIRAFTRDLVIEGTVVTVKEKPRLSDVMNEPKAFLNVTNFQSFPKALWFSSVSAGQAPVPMGEGTYIAVGKAQIEALHVVDPAIDPEKT